MSPSFPPERELSTCVVALFAGSILLSAPASGQSFSRDLATADRFFELGVLPDDLSILVDPTLGGAVKGVVGYSFSAGVTYDSNVNLSNNNAQDDVYFNINPSVFYSSDPEGGARHAITAYYSPNPQFNRDSSTTGGSSTSFNHNGGVAYRFQGSKTSISAFVNLSQASGSDRFTGGFSEGSIFSYGISGSYQVAPRTTISGTLSSAYSTFETAGQEGGDFIRGSFGASWAATEKLSFGPSINATWSDSENTGQTTTVSLSFNTQYEVTELIDLSASIGVQGISYSANDDRDPQLTGALRFDYVLSPIWTWTGALSFANLPSPTSVGVAVNDWAFSTSIQRPLGVGSLSASAGFAYSTFDPVGILPPGGTPDNSTFYSLGVSYSRPFFTDRISFSSDLNYLSATGSADWDKWVASCSWGLSF